MEPVITISASYGSGGSVVGPALAGRFALPFVDRLLSADASVEATRSAASGEGITEAEAAASPGSRLFTYLARVAGVGTLTTPPPTAEPELELRARCEEDLAAARAGAGAVVLGRAGAVTLAGRPRCYHIRLDGPRQRRIDAAAAIEGIDGGLATERQARTDRARELWVKRLYRADPTDPRWYHLVVDTTVLGVEGAVEVVALASARALDL